jgi:hypothetical protein
MPKKEQNWYKNSYGKYWIESSKNNVVHVPPHLRANSDGTTINIPGYCRRKRSS